MYSCGAFFVLTDIQKKVNPISNDITDVGAKYLADALRINAVTDFDSIFKCSY